MSVPSLSLTVALKLPLLHSIHQPIDYRCLLVQWSVRWMAGDRTLLRQRGICCLLHCKA